MDQSRKAFRKEVVAESPPIERSNFKIFDKDISVGQKSAQQFLAGALRKIKGDPVLVAIDAEEIWRGTADKGRTPTTRFVAGRGLDLEDVCTMITEDLCAKRTAQHAAEINHFQ